MRYPLFRRSQDGEPNVFFFFFNEPATTEIYPLSLHDALPIFAQPAWRWSSSNRARVEASRSEPTSCHDGSTPVSSRSRRYSPAPYIIIVVSVTELRSCPTSPAEWKVEPEVSSARSTSTTSVQPRSAR